MREAWTWRSSWAVSRRAKGALLGCALALGTATAEAQDSLQLRRSDTLSDPRPAAAPPEESIEPLRLKASPELVPLPALPATGAELSEALFEVDINRQGLNETVLLLRRPDGTFLVSHDDLERWRLRAPPGVPLVHQGKSYYPLNALPGVNVDADAQRMKLAIVTRPEAFQGTVDTVRGADYPPPVLPSPGGFLNYSVFATEAPGTHTQNGLFEGVFFSRQGVLSSSLLAPELGKVPDWVRLDTTYNIDNPDKRTSLRLGDTVNQPGTWGRAVRFGGVQYSTNFGTQPGFIRNPVQAALGSATLPSTVDVYVNNALARQVAVPPGPFAITNIPTISGSGEVRLVVTDLLGNQQIITTPFYGSAQLLRAGVEDFSFEAGTTRREFGIESDSYGPPLGSATYRRGWTDTFTSEVRSEYSGGVGALGATGVVRAGNFGLASATYAGSHSDAGYGSLAGLGLERTTGTLSYSAQTQWTTDEFRQIGMESGELPRTRQTVLSVGYQFGGFGSFSAARVVQVFRDRPSNEVISLTYSVPIGRLLNFSVGALYIPGPTGATSIRASLVVPFGDLTSASLGVEQSRSATGQVDRSESLFVQKSPPPGDGYGYRAQARTSNSFGTDLLAGVTLQNSTGMYTADVAQGGGSSDTALRLGATGGVGLLGGHTFMSRTITDSFGVVQVADFPNVRVLQDNQVVTSTDRHGYAVLPRMRAYDRNQVGIDQRDLPFDAVVDRMRVDAVPYYRSGVLVGFPVRRVRAATLTVVLADGRLMPSGALARVLGNEEQFPVALRGELYLEGLQASNKVEVTWKGRSCVLDVVYPKTEDFLPNLGRYVCTGVEP